MAVQDQIWINISSEKVFSALTEGRQLVKWWPKKATSTPKKGGELILHWMGEGKLESSFETFEENKKVAYPFYTEHLTFELKPRSSGTDVFIQHRCTEKSAIHVAQVWGFLKANLKVYLEHGIDLRKDPSSNEKKDESEG